MSGTWHGGKGSEDRTADAVKYKKNLGEIDWSKDLSGPLVAGGYRPGEITCAWVEHPQTPPETFESLHAMLLEVIRNGLASPYCKDHQTVILSKMLPRVECMNITNQEALGMTAICLEFVLEINLKMLIAGIETITNQHLYPQAVVR
jgi:hypothetical protein